jgi:hypothetical protein
VINAGWYKWQRPYVGRQIGLQNLRRDINNVGGIDGLDGSQMKKQPGFAAEDSAALSIKRGSMLPR